jgi:hypothetical protein
MHTAAAQKDMSWPSLSLELGCMITQETSEKMSLWDSNPGTSQIQVRCFTVGLFWITNMKRMGSRIRPVTSDKKSALGTDSFRITQSIFGGDHMKAWRQTLSLLPEKLNVSHPLCFGYSKQFDKKIEYFVIRECPEDTATSYSSRDRQQRQRWFRTQTFISTTTTLTARCNAAHRFNLITHALWSDCIMRNFIACTLRQI